jgi:hypothetical protein
MAWYRLRQVEAPWGEHGRILISGISRRGDDGVLEVERAGPFVLPIDPLWLGDILVVTNSFRRSIESSRLKGAHFREVRKVRIVLVDWSGWDRNAEHPAELPPDGKPENYIFGREHDPALAEQIGPLWEIYAEKSPEETRADFARAPGFHQLSGSGVVVSDRARKWLTAHAAEWIRTERIESRPGLHRRLLSRLLSSDPGRRH